LRVRVSNIEPGTSTPPSLSAEVEEIPTPGLPVGRFDRLKGRRPSLRWQIGTSFPLDSSEHCWYMGYGGWSLFFDPRIVQGVVDLASRFPNTASSYERYKQLLEFLMDNKAYEQPR